MQWQRRISFAIVAGVLSLGLSGRPRRCGDARSCVAELWTIAAAHEGQGISTDLRDAAERVIAFGDDAIAPLRAGLRSGNHREVEVSAYALSRSGTMACRAEPDLTTAAVGGSGWAAAALGRCGSETAVETLYELVLNGHDAAVDALASSESGARRLAALVGHPGLTAPVQSAMVLVFKDLGPRGAAAVPLFRERLRRSDEPFEVLRALASMGPEALDATPEIHALLANPDANLRDAAVATLAMLHDSAALPFIRTYVESSKDFERRHGYVLATFLGPPSEPLVSVISKSIREREWTEQVEIANYLRAISSARGRDPLLSLVRSQSWRVAAYAEGALLRLGVSPASLSETAGCMWCQFLTPSPDSIPRPFPPFGEVSASFPPNRCGSERREWRFETTKGSTVVARWPASESNDHILESTGMRFEIDSINSNDGSSVIVRRILSTGSRPEMEVPGIPLGATIDSASGLTLVTDVGAFSLDRAGRAAVRNCEAPNTVPLKH